MASINSTMDTAEKMKALEAAKLQIEKQFGQGAIMKLACLYGRSTSYIRP